MFSGLTLVDAEDMSQDIVTWLVSSGKLESALVAPWLAAVIQNFLLRYLRRRWRENRQNSIASTNQGLRVTGHFEPTEARLFLERLASRSPICERRLIALMAAGLRLSEAAKQVGIRHGSEQYHLGQIRARAKRLTR